MAEKNLQKMNPNVADEMTLQQLPGIGPSLAERIVQSRPYGSLEDLEKIRGIGKSVLERMAPMLVFDVPEDLPPTGGDEEIQGGEKPAPKLSTAEAKPTIAPSDGQKVDDLKQPQPVRDLPEGEGAKTAGVDEKEGESQSPPKSVKKPLLVRAFSRSETIWLVIAAGVLSLILSVSLSLIILGGINGTLDFNQLQGLKQVESDVGTLEENLGSLSSNLDALDQRLTPLEGLTGRMTAVEDLTETLKGDVEDALANVEAMQSDLDRLSNETARLSGRVDRFDTFLDGLRRLITEIFAAPSGETLPES
jgi:hypothetical protein